MLESDSVAVMKILFPNGMALEVSSVEELDRALAEVGSVGSFRVRLVPGKELIVLVNGPYAVFSYESTESSIGARIAVTSTPYISDPTFQIDPDTEVPSKMVFPRSIMRDVVGHYFNTGTLLPMLRWESNPESL